MAMTDEEKGIIVQEVLNQVQAQSSGAADLENVSSLDGVESLPAMKGEKLVNVPLNLLGKPAEDAAKNANAAASNAENAASGAQAAASTAENAAQEALSSAMGANSAASYAAQAANNANSAAGRFESTALAALKGATARFDEITNVPSSRILKGIPAESVGGLIVYNVPTNSFAYCLGTQYYSDWEDTAKPRALYLDDELRVLKDKIFLCGATMYVWSDEEGNLVEASGSGSGAGFYNVTTQQPLGGGFYTLQTAVEALAGAKVKDEYKPGMIITFEAAAGKWIDYRFASTDINNFLNVASWEEYGGGKIKEIALNGQTVSPDPTGKVNLTFDQINVDASLDPESSNPVQNSAIAGALNEVQDKTLASVEVDTNDEGTVNTMSFYNKNGGKIASVDFAAGGGGGGESTVSKIKLQASINKTQVKEGGEAELTYTYDHLNADGESDGVKANITIEVKRGSTTALTQTYNDVSAGTYTLDLSPYLLAGTVDVYVRAKCVNAEGIEQSKQAYSSVSVITLTLASSFNIASALANGGYVSGESIEIPFTITGSGTKEISMYLDGGSTPTTQTITKSGTVNGSFTIQASSLSAGRHTVQLVAERSGLLSESIYLDILKAGLSTPFIGTKIVFKDGRIFTNKHLTPTIATGQYELVSFEYVCYDPKTTPATMLENRNGVLSNTISAARSVQTYNNRFMEQGTASMQFVCGTTSYNFFVEVSESDLDIGEAVQGLVMKLTANGRSNGESNPAQWTSGDVTTTFEGVDWKTSGWIDNSLKLMNGAKAVIRKKVFESDFSSTGASIEMEIRVSNVTDRDAAVISCIHNNLGFLITAEEAAMYTGSTKEVETAEGGKVTTPVGVSMKFASDMWLKIAFVIGKRNEGRLMELYINGIRSKADIYGNGDYFNQTEAQEITLTSDCADIEIRTVRVYNRAITDDEEFGNFAIDRQTVDEMSELVTNNDVMNEDGTEVDIDKLLKKGKGVILFVRKNGLSEINSTNDKDKNFLCDWVVIYTPWGDVIQIKNCYVRIQGTSSTKYPRKNYRIYCAKGSDPEVWINGVKQNSNAIAVMEGDFPVKVLCPKCDYSDSSMTHNTGNAKLFNDTFKELGLLTPPQEIDRKVRTTINGYPVDVFSAETLDGERTYYGQYNLNNDKSDWADVTGMNAVTDAEGNKVEWECPISLEFLNNSFALGNFKVESTTADALESEMEGGFDDALEFNFPKDIYWSAAKADKKGGKTPSDKQKTAIKRLWSWVKSCVPAGADMSCKDLSTWKSDKFKNEVANYLPVQHLCTYYLFTDYNVLVDQRVKNMILRTWDGLLWYFTYYDGDTAYLLRNDCFLAYLYTIDRETYDNEKGGYAFEGHDSWLWCLVLANLETELKSCATNLRAVLTTERVLAMMNEEQAGNWCERLYNKSGKFKYIDPQIEGVDVNGSTVTYPYIYALQGSREAHRTHTIKNRFALLDARYETGNFMSDNIDLYMSRNATDAATRMIVTANELYYFGYGTNNSPSIQASQKAQEGGEVELKFNEAFSLNDPVRIYGASRIRKLVTGTAGDELVGNFNINKCTSMRVLDMSTTGYGGDVFVSLDACRQLEEVSFLRQSKVRTGSKESTELDMSKQTRLRIFNARGTNSKSILFAKGAPLEKATLPGTLTTLRLEYLPNLASSMLTIDGYSSVETFIFAACPGLDWQNLLSKCTNVKRIRVEGINTTGDGSLLAAYMRYGGIDAEGNATETCGFVGTYKLTQYIDDAVFEGYKAHYPELNIIQPEFTTIEFDDSIPDAENISNLDNLTGYNYGNNYEPSGHIARILAKRHRVLAKKSGEGKVTVFPLHDENSNYYADNDNVNKATAAVLTGSEGEVFMFEPHYWYKGINDHINKKKYALYSSNADCPKAAESVKLLFGDLEVKSGYAIRSGVEYATLANAETPVSANSYCIVDVEGYKQARFPGLVSAVYGAVFLDAENNIVGRMKATSDSGIINGMYLFSAIPEGATKLAFSIVNAAAFDYVLLTKSEELEAIEPDWVEHEACLCGVYEARVADDVARSISGVQSSASISQADFEVYANNRGKGFQLVDWEMHKDVCNLFYAKYGNRDSQGTCGYGSSTTGRATGLTNEAGMTDTHANPTTPTENTAYLTLGDTEKNINSPNVMGYENWQGNKAEWLGKTGFNVAKIDYQWVSTMPDGSQRRIQGLQATGDLYPCNVVHGRFMDIVVARSGGSTSTYYFDNCYQAGSTARVVCRSSSYANAYGGVAFSYASYDSSYTYSFIGSRLAFRGEIVFAESVEAFKALREVA